MPLIHPNLNAAPPVATRADGIYVWAADGRRYVDASSGAVCVNIGHNSPVVARSMTSAIAQLDYVVRTAFDNVAAAELAELIATDWAPPQLGHVWFSSSGSDAVETGLRLARQYWVERGHPERYKIVSLRHSYHGSTFGALAATGREPRAMYQPYFSDAWLQALSPYPYRCPLACGGCHGGCADDLEATIQRADPSTVAAVLLEPIVGLTTGGTSGSPEYYAAVADLCERHGILLIADEVMTGFGRTGAKFGFEHFGLRPDIVPTGKGLGCGYVPLFATLVADRVIETIRAGSATVGLGNTYNAHPLSCRVATDILRHIGDAGLVENARVRGEQLLAGLTEMGAAATIVGDVRGHGLLCGIELVADRTTGAPFDVDARAAARVSAEIRSEGVVVAARSGTIDNVLGDHLVVAPPLVVTEAQVDEIVTGIRAGITRAERALREGAIA